MLFIEDKKHRGWKFDFDMIETGPKNNFLEDEKHWGWKFDFDMIGDGAKK